MHGWRRSDGTGSADDPHPLSPLFSGNNAQEDVVSQLKKMLELLVIVSNGRIHGGKRGATAPLVYSHAPPPPQLPPNLPPPNIYIFTIIRVKPNGLNV